MKFVLELNTELDNDSVMEAVFSMLNCGTGSGYDDLLDSLNGAYEADRRVSRGADTMGRASLHAALERIDEVEGWDDEVRTLLLTGMLRRAIGLKML